MENENHLLLNKVTISEWWQLGWGAIEKGRRQPGIIIWEY